MKPLEVERPWIKRKLGLKMLGSVIVVFIITFAILSLFGFYNGGTVNVQSINVSFSDQKIKTYSYAYGKETFSTGKKIVMNIQFNDNGINSTADITGPNIFNPSFLFIHGLSTSSGFIPSTKKFVLAIYIFAVILLHSHIHCL